MRNRQALLLLSIGFSLALVVSAVIAVAPHTVLAQASVQTVGTPSTNSGSGLVPCNGTDCQACSIVSLINNLINFAIGLSIPIAIGMFAWAGVLYFTSASAASGENVSRAKRIFTDALVGFMIALGAYLVIQTILHTILAPQYFNGWNSVQCVDSDQSRPGSTDSNGKNIGDLLNEVLGNPQPTIAVGTTNGTTECGVGLSYDSSTGQCCNLSHDSCQAPLTGQCTTGFTYSAATGQCCNLTHDSCHPAIAPTTSSGASITSYGPGGTLIPVTFAPTRSVAEMQTIYLQVQSKYGAQISSACANASFSNCEAIVTADIVQESSGNPSAYNDKSGAQGLMQSTANGCGSNTQCQINAGVKQLSENYNQFANLPNALAAYNSGNSTTPGQSVSGKNSAMVASNDCQGEYAWQCPINPGGLTETQGYVANICALLGNNGVSC